MRERTKLSVTVSTNLDEVESQLRRIETILDRINIKIKPLNEIRAENVRRDAQVK